MQRRNFLKGLAVLAAAPALIELPVEGAVPLAAVVELPCKQFLYGAAWLDLGDIVVSGGGYQWRVVSKASNGVLEIELLSNSNVTAVNG